MPVVHPIPYREPLVAFAPLAGGAGAVLLESACAGSGEGRFSYIGVEPARLLRAPGGGDPFAAVARELAGWPRPPAGAPVPFTGGAIGFFGYELGGWLETLPPPRPDELGVPEMVVGFYHSIAAFDHQRRQAWVLSCGDGDQAAALAARLGTAPLGEPEVPPEEDALVWRADFSPEAYRRRVERVIGYIRAGDIFQANFTQRFQARRPAGLSGFDLYRRLRALSPAPFAAYLNCGEGVELVSASPERFLSLAAGGRVATWPIKGTRPRGATPEEDRRLRAELVASAKDHAENLMICDLMRNDLGRVCEIGSIRVPELAAPRSFASVHHLVSVVEGRLRPGLGPLDLLRATFPGGSVTGAPKIRAMEIIHELEAARRGPYCGAIAWIGGDGAMDSSIVIRTLTVTPERLIAQAGGGIVAESDPEAEYQEMLTKVHPLLAAAGSVRLEHDLAE